MKKLLGDSPCGGPCAAPQVQRLAMTVREKKNTPKRSVCCGARGGRTLTMSPSTDFKSVASADSATAPTHLQFYRI